jgi:hypothetical protein
MNEDLDLLIEKKRVNPTGITSTTILLDIVYNSDVNEPFLSSTQTPHM